MDATPFVPDTRSLKTLREAAADCRGCPLHGPATQTVFGEGPRRAAAEREAFTRDLAAVAARLR